MMNETYIVQLEQGVWLADGEGDPARTLYMRTAKSYKTERAANLALKKAREYRPFADAVVKKLTTTYKER